MSYLIDKNDMEAYLGRPLTKLENKNYSLYLGLAVDRLQSLLCTTLSAPLDSALSSLLAGVFGLREKEQQYTDTLGISSKQVEDFRLTYDSQPETPMEAFVRLHNAEIVKYSECQGKIRSGKVTHERFQPL